jgi:hypothetical protein
MRHKTTYLYASESVGETLYEGTEVYIKEGPIPVPAKEV